MASSSPYGPMHTTSPMAYGFWSTRPGTSTGTLNVCQPAQPARWPMTCWTCATIGHGDYYTSHSRQLGLVRTLRAVRYGLHGRYRCNGYGWCALHLPSACYLARQAPRC